MVRGDGHAQRFAAHVARVAILEIGNNTDDAKSMAAGRTSECLLCQAVPTASTLMIRISATGGGKREGSSDGTLPGVPILIFHRAAGVTPITILRR